MAKRDDEALRMVAVTKARAFKRSWVDMAEVLVEVRDRGLYRRWGYETLHGYALEELHIKRSTVDKLTGSYHALEQHVPHVLSWDGVAQSMPEIEAVDYFARAVNRESAEGEPRRTPPPREVVEELKQAIFEEQVSAPSLRRRFNSVLNPKPERESQRDVVERVKQSAKRLEAMLADVDGLTEERVENVTTALEELRRDLDELSS